MKCVRRFSGIVRLNHSGGPQVGHLKSCSRGQQNEPLPPAIIPFITMAQGSLHSRAELRVRRESTGLDLIEEDCRMLAETNWVGMILLAQPQGSRKTPSQDYSHLGCSPRYIFSAPVLFLCQSADAGHASAWQVLRTDSFP